jgi:hypothetical protein
MKRFLFVSLALLLPAAAAAAPFHQPVQKLCAALRQDGWTAPLGPLTGRPGRAEVSIPGVMYLCTLTRVLQPAGRGHAPDLQALISDDGKVSQIILSADVWCEADRTATFAALAQQVERLAASAASAASAGSAGNTGSPGGVPSAITAAIRAGTKATATALGLSFEVSPIEVEPAACTSVPAGQLGPVLMKIDVEIKPAR